MVRNQHHLCSLTQQLIDLCAQVRHSTPSLPGTLLMLHTQHWAGNQFNTEYGKLVVFKEPESL